MTSTVEQTSEDFRRFKKYLNKIIEYQHRKFEEQKINLTFIPNYLQSYIIGKEFNIIDIDPGGYVVVDSKWYDNFREETMDQCENIDTNYLYEEKWQEWADNHIVPIMEHNRALKIEAEARKKKQLPDKIKKLEEQLDALKEEERQNSKTI